MKAGRALAVGAALAWSALIAPGPAGAQIGQVHLGGSIDEDGTVESLRIGSQSFRTFSLGSRYAPTLDGFVLDPRLLTFSFSGAFADQQTIATTGDTRALSVEPYRFAVNVFPHGLNSFTLRASRTASDFDFEQGRISTTTDTKGAGWAFRGTAGLPEASLDFTRETVDERVFTGSTERTRSTLALMTRKSFDRFQPRLGYTAELTETTGLLADTPGFRDGLRQRLQYDDRIRIGERAVLAPLLDFEVGPDRNEANGNLTLTGPLSPTADGSAGLRYSVFGLGGFNNHTAAVQGQLTNRFTPNVALITIGNASYVSGHGQSAWGAGGLASLRAVPLASLATVTDYGLQLSGGETGTTASHRGHLNAVSTALPLHTVTGDYFLTLTQAGELGSFASHSGSLEVASQVIPLTTATAGYALELQQGGGDRERHAWRLAAEVRPRPSIFTRAGATYFTETAAGGGRARSMEHGLIADATVGARVGESLDFLVSGRYGRKDVSREDRHGPVDVAGVLGSVGVKLGTLFLRGEGFLERDEDARQYRQGVRGNISYRFRVWTITAEFEVSRLTSQGIDIARDRLVIRVTRPLDFTWP